MKIYNNFLYLHLVLGKSLLLLGQHETVMNHSSIWVHPVNHNGSG